MWYKHFRAVIVTTTAGWKVSLSNTQAQNGSVDNLEVEVAAPLTDVRSEDNENIVYWIAPSEFLGDQVCQI